MKELEFLEHWINEHYLNKRFSIRPIQRCFSNDDKNYQNNVIYFGCFSGDVIVHTPFQVQPLNLKDTHSRYFIFSHLNENSNVDHTFIGYEITFLDLFIQHEVLPPVNGLPTFLSNLIYLRLGGCNVTNTTLFTMYHKNGVIYEDLEATIPFDGVNETYSFSYNLVRFYSCIIAPNGVVMSLNTCELPINYYCPLMSDFTSSLNSIPMTNNGSGFYESDLITYNGVEPVNTVLRWYAQGQSSYPAFETAPYDNAIKTNLNLVSGQTFRLSYYIGSSENSYNVVVNAKVFECENQTPQEPIEPLPLPVSHWQAIHPLEHPAVDSVTYLDENGEEQTQILTRLEDSENNPCTLIEGIVISHSGCVPCEPQIDNPIPFELYVGQYLPNEEFLFIVRNVNSTIYNSPFKIQIKRFSEPQYYDWDSFETFQSFTIASGYSEPDNIIRQFYIPNQNDYFQIRFVDLNNNLISNVYTVGGGL